MTQLYRTTNGGTNWSLQFTFSEQINDIYFFNHNVGVVSAPAANKRTTDGGLNWVQTNEGGVKLAFANDSIGWAGNNFNLVMKTTDGGKTWFRQTSPIFTAFAIVAKDTNKAWAGGSGVIHTTDGGGPPVGIQQIINETPSEYKLYQNYPNPFNPNTIIRYQINKLSDVRIIVFDIQGRQISELVKQKQNAGTYETDFSGTTYSSGIYFYSLFAGGKLIDTKKMILLK